jgi:hypothetical protein
MNGHRRFGASALSGVAAAALVLGAGLAFAPIGSARAAPAPEFTLEFGGLEPGVPQTDVGAFTIEQAADLVLFEWSEATGLLAGIDTQVGERVALDVEVCDSAGMCLDPRSLAGPVPFAAGVGSLTVTAQLTAAVEPGESGSVVGRLAFVGEETGLAATGSDAAQLLAAALASIAVGALVFALVRRRGELRDAGSG